MVEFAVNDNGIDEYHDRIFVIFGRLLALAGCEGTGIGFAVARKNIDRHGGTVRVESVPGDGSTLVFPLPAA